MVVIIMLDEYSSVVWWSLPHWMYIAVCCDLYLCFRCILQCGMVVIAILDVFSSVL